MKHDKYVVRVAVKVINKRLVGKREYTKWNLRREAAMLRRLQHPNIVILLLLIIILTIIITSLFLLQVAVKVIKKRLVGKREYTERNLRREAAMVRRLQYPNIVIIIITTIITSLFVLQVAVKVINKRLVGKREYTKRNLRREAAMLRRLQHPNIVQLYEVMETENSYYLVMELAEGGDFFKYIDRK